MKQRFLSLLAAALLAGPIASQAAPVTYLESVIGDLPGSGSLVALLLDVGVNTVQGSFGRDATVGDFDSFGFIVQAGSEVVAATVTLTDAIGDITDASWFLRSGSAVAVQGAFVEVFQSPSPGSYSLSSGPLAAGAYNFQHSGIAFDSRFGPAFFSDYTFSLTVQRLATVPEPTSLALVGLALLGAAVARRKFAA